MPGDIIILHKCTTSYNHMLYCSWDMVLDRCICYFLFWAIFCPFMPPYLAAQKIKIFKRWETFLEISSFYICVPKTMIRWCKVTEISCMMDGWMDRWMDAWTEKVTYGGGCPTSKLLKWANKKYKYFNIHKN